MLGERGGELTSRRPSPQGRRFMLACLAATAIAGFLTVALATPMLEARTREVLSDIALIPLTALVAATALWRARSSSRRMGVPWLLMGIAGVMWLAAEVCWFVVHYFVEDPQTPSVADVFYIAAMPFAAAALAVFPPRIAPGSERTRSVLGALVVGGSVLFVGGAVLFDRVFPVDVSTATSGAAVLVAYPIGDTVMASLALIALVRFGTRIPLHLALLSIGFIGYSLADTVYSYRASNETFLAGSWIDLGWVFGYLFFALAALAPSAGADTLTTEDHTLDRRLGLSNLVVYVPLLVAVLVAASEPLSTDNPVLIVTGLVVLVLFGIRQVLLATENTRLRHDLESQVQQLRHRSADLRRLAAQNERVLRHVVDGILGIDQEGRIIFVNGAAAEMIGRSQDELLGLPERSLLSPPDPSNLLHRVAAEDIDIVGRALRSGEVVASATTRYRRADGTDFPVELAVGPVLEDETITGAVLVFRDISVRREVEKMKDDFMSVVSHELRTPLTSIRGSLGLLAGGMGGSLDTTGRRMTQIALSSSERLSRLIDDMLDIERMESGTLALAVRPVRAADLINSAVESMSPLAAERRVKLNRGDISGWVTADSDRIVQTLINLIGNAIKFSPTDSDINLTARPSLERYVEFGVQDFGRGIPAANREGIFERFEQVDSSDSREKGGTGLGLAICRDLVRLHGGDIWVESELGVGSTFWFTLPIGIHPEPDSLELVEPPVQKTAAGPAEHALPS